MRALVKLRIYWITLNFLYLLSGALWAQHTYFDMMIGGDNSYKVGMVPIADGHYLTANISAQPIGSIRHDLVLQKFDSCGALVASRAYHFPDDHILSIMQVMCDQFENKIWIALHSSQNQHDGIIATFDFDLALLAQRKITNASGPFYTYSLGQNGNGNTFLYGNNSNGSCLIELNQNLEIVNQNGIVQTVIWGDFLPTQDGGFICHSGSVYYKLDANLNLIWSRIMLGARATHQWVELADGYICSSYPYGSNQSNVLIKVDKTDGGIMWVTRELKSISKTKIILLPNNIVLQLGNHQSNDADNPVPLLTEIDGASGAVRRSTALSTATEFSFTAADAFPIKNGGLMVLGHDQDFYQLFKAKVYLDSAVNCPQIDVDVAEDFPAVMSQLHTVNPIESGISLSDLAVIEVNPNMYIERRCSRFSVPQAFLPIDTMLCANQSIHIDLRNAQYPFSWSDGWIDPQRDIQAPAHLILEFMACDTTWTYAIDVGQEDCSCKVYLPNAFSPNGDGINETLTVHSPCAFESYTLQVFDRWGALLFESRDPNQAWNGRANDKLASADVYIVALEYSLMRNGQLESVQEAQEVHLIR